MKDRQYVKRELNLFGLVEKFNIPYIEVMRVYALFNARVYSKAKTNKLFIKSLENKTYDLTERYFMINNIKEDKHK